MDVNSSAFFTFYRMQTASRKPATTRTGGTQCPAVQPSSFADAGASAEAPDDEGSVGEDPPSSVSELATLELASPERYSPSIASPEPTALTFPIAVPFNNDAAIVRADSMNDLRLLAHTALLNVPETCSGSPDVGGDTCFMNEARQVRPPQPFWLRERPTITAKLHGIGKSRISERSSSTEGPPLGYHITEQPEFSPTDHDGSAVAPRGSLLGSQSVLLMSIGDNQSLQYCTPTIGADMKPMEPDPLGVCMCSLNGLFSVRANCVLIVCVCACACVCVRVCVVYVCTVCTLYNYVHDCGSNASIMSVCMPV